MAAGEAFSREQRLRIDEAVSAMERQTGLKVSVYVGQVEGDTRSFAAQMLAGLRHLGPEVLLIVVAPTQRHLQVITSSQARRRLSDQACGLAELSMATSFRVGDLTGGIVVGLRMLADATVAASAYPVGSGGDPG